MFTDFRTYLTFDLESVNREGASQRLSKTMGKKTGGETQPRSMLQCWLLSLSYTAADEIKRKTRLALSYWMKTVLKWTESGLSEMYNCCVSSIFRSFSLRLPKKLVILVRW